MLMMNVRKSGLSMVELMVAVIIFTIMAIGIYTILFVGQEFWLSSKTRVELQQEARRAMEKMINELRQAGDLSISDVPADGTWRNTITFKTPSGVAAGALTWNADSIQYSRGGVEGMQFLRTSAGVAQVIALDIQSLQFRRQVASPNILEISIQAQKATEKNKTINYTLNFNIRLRN